MTTQSDLIHSINASLYRIAAATNGNDSLHEIDDFAAKLRDKEERIAQDREITRRRRDVLGLPYQDNFGESGKPAITQEEFLDGLEALGLFDE